MILFVITETVARSVPLGKSPTSRMNSPVQKKKLYQNLELFHAKEKKTLVSRGKKPGFREESLKSGFDLADDLDITLVLLLRASLFPYCCSSLKCYTGFLLHS